MREIKVSVVIPVYNVEKYLHECMDSVINQTLKEIEIICVDDGSTDSSLSILQEYAKNDDRITVLQQENQGAGTARNVGLDIAKGEYMHFMDSDDYLELNAYEVMYTSAKKHNVDMLKTKVYAIDDKTGKYVSNKPLYSLANIEKGDFNRVLFLKDDHKVLTSVSVVPWNGIYKRKFLDKNNIRFNNLICVNDRSFYSNVIINSKKIIIIPEYTITHRINVDGSLVDIRVQNFDCCIESYKIIEKQCVDMSDEQRNIILSEEIASICVLFNEYRLDETYGKEILNKTKLFLLNLGLEYLYENFSDNECISIFLKSIFEIQVTVIVPVYNAEEYLYECIHSLVNQTLYGIEIIFVDDGSVDNSVKIIEEYAKKDERIILIKQENQGGGIARNRALEVAKGEYVTFLDSDDIMLSYALHFLLKTARENDNCDIVISKASTFKESVEDARVLTYCVVKKYVPIWNNFSVEDYSHYLLQVSSGVVWSKMFRNDFIKANGFCFLPSIRFHDFYFTYWAFAMAQNIAILNKSTILYRSVEGSNSLQQTKEETPLTSYENQRLLWNKLVEVGKSQQVKQSFVNRIVYRNFQVLSTSKTVESLELRFEAFKSDLKFYNIDINDKNYFYTREAYYNTLRVADSLTIDEYLFNEYYSFYNKGRIPKAEKDELDKKQDEIDKFKNEIILLKSEVNKYKGQVDFHVNDKEVIKSTLSYQLGRFITWLPRKIRDFL